MAAQRFSVYDSRPTTLRAPPRRTFQQLLLLSSLLCTTLGLLHIEPRLPNLARLMRSH